MQYNVSVIMRHHLAFCKNVHTEVRSGSRRHSDYTTDWVVWIRIRVGEKIFFSLLQNVQTGSEALSASYSVGAGGKTTRT